MAQVSNTGLPVSIASNTTVRFLGGNFSTNGDLTNEGVLSVERNLEILGEYSGSGEIRLSGADQNLSMDDSIAVLTLENGDKSLLADLVIQDLTFIGSRLLVNGNNLEITGTITGADQNSHVVGRLIRSGNTTLDFPVSDGSDYLPVTLTSISGTTPSIAVEAINADPNGTAGRGLLAVSQNRYWNIEEVSGTFNEAIAQLTVSNETVAGTLGDLAVAIGTATGTEFRGLGQSANTGDLISGTVTAATPSGAGIYALGRFFDENLRVADSVALVTIYEATSGDDWNNNSGWLASEIDTWSGVTIQNKRVNAVDISGNNLTQTFPEITDGLEDLQSLDISDNELTEMGSISALTALSVLDISNNRLQFGDLENIANTLPSTNYIPQKRVLDSLRILEEVGSVYTMDRSVTGSANSYSWTRDGNDISQSGPSFDINIQDFSSDGIYVAEVTNSNVPGLTLTTKPVVLRVSSIERDRESLRQVYLALNAGEKGVSDWFASDNPADWDEVVVENNRVTEVNLSGFDLTGQIPVEILDVEGLVSLDFSDNLITGIPNLENSLPNLGQDDFDVTLNKLDFGDIEPVFGDNRYNYSPQKPLIGDTYSQIDQGTDTTLVYQVGGSSNMYNWKFNGVFISGEGSDSLLIENISRENMGDYELQVTSSIVDDLVISSGIQTILAQADITLVPVYEDIDGEDGVFDSEDEIQGELYKITQSGRYTGIDTVHIVNNAVIFPDKILDDYVVLVRPLDTVLIKEKNGVDDSVKVLPTYYKNSIDWQEAAEILLNEDFEDSVFMELQPRPLPPLPDGGRIQMLVESDFADDTDEGGRIEARRKVRKAGCSLRRRIGSGGGGRIDQDDEFELIAYKETDDNGNVSFGDLPTGEYRLNIQYPGIPMDPDSFTEFVIEEGSEGVEFNLEATVTEEGITVQLIEALGFYRKYFKNLDVYPNPADQYLTIRYEKLMSENVKVKLLNMNGKVVREADVRKGYQQSMELDVSEVEGGIYLLYFYDPGVSEQNISIFKVIVRH